MSWVAIIVDPNDNKVKIEIISQIIRKKITCNTCIRINTFKIKHNFYYKNINN